MDLKTGHATNSLLGHTLSESDQSTVYDKLNSLAITARIVNVTVALHDIGWYTTDTRVQDNLAILDPSPLETTTDSTSTGQKKRRKFLCVKQIMCWPLISPTRADGEHVLNEGHSEMGRYWMRFCNQNQKPSTTNVGKTNLQVTHRTSGNGNALYAMIHIEPVP